MNVVDSSGWLEYFANGPNADFFAPAVEDTSNLIVPSITIFEVFKRVLQQRSESEALQVAALMQEGRVVNLDVSISLQAVRVSVDHRLPLADSVILATLLPTMRFSGLKMRISMACLACSTRRRV